MEGRNGWWKRSKRPEQFVKGFRDRELDLIQMKQREKRPKSASLTMNKKLHQHSVAGFKGKFSLLCRRNLSARHQDLRLFVMHAWFLKLMTDFVEDIACNVGNVYVEDVFLADATTATTCNWYYRLPTVTQNGRVEYLCLFKRTSVLLPLMELQQLLLAHHYTKWQDLIHGSSKMKELVAVTILVLFFTEFPNFSIVPVECKDVNRGRK